MKTQQLRSYEIGPDFELDKEAMMAAVLTKNTAVDAVWREEVGTPLDRVDEVIVEAAAATKDWAARNTVVIAEGATVAATTAALAVSGMAMTGPKLPNTKNQVVVSDEITAKVPAGGLKTLAIEYSTTVPAIVKANPTIITNPNHPNDVKAGETLIIPKSSTAPVVPTTSTSTTSPETATTPTSVPSANSAPVVTPSKNIYLLGDSLLDGEAQNGLPADLANKGWTVSKIEATVGDNVADAIPKVKADASVIKDSSTAVVELGTNNCKITETVFSCESEPEFAGQIQDMVSTLRGINPNIAIDWVNTYTTRGSGNQSINEAISADAGPDKYNVIDWAGYAAAHTSQFSFDPVQGIHQTTYAGYANEANVIASSIGTAPAPVSAPAPAPKAEAVPIAPTTTTTTEAPATITTTTTAPESEAQIEAELDPKSVTAMMRYLHFDLGYPIAAAAGILGNAYGVESGGLPTIPGDLNPERLEGSPYGSETPISALTPSEISNPELGYGLFQFTPISKLLDFAAHIGQDPANPFVQILFVVNEIKGTELDAILHNPDITPQDAAYQFMMLYEHPQGSDGDPIYGAAAESLPWRVNAAVAFDNTYAPLFTSEQSPAPTPAPAQATTTTTTTSPPPVHPSPTPAPQPAVSDSKTVAATTLKVPPNRPLVSKPQASTVH